MFVPTWKINLNLIFPREGEKTEEEWTCTGECDERRTKLLSLLVRMRGERDGKRKVVFGGTGNGNIRWIPTGLFRIWTRSRKMRKEEWKRMRCLFYPYASGENGKGGWKVVFGVCIVWLTSWYSTEIILYAEDVQQGAVRTRQGRAMLNSLYYHHLQVILKLSSLIIILSGI